MRGSGEGPVSRVLSRVVISLGRRLPVASSDRPGGHGGPDPPDKAPCLILLPVGFTKPGRSPDLLVRSYRTVSPLPPGTPEGPRSAVCSLWHFPYPCGRWALPTTVSCGARTFLHAAGSFRPGPKDPSTQRPLGPLRRPSAGIVGARGGGSTASIRHRLSRSNLLGNLTPTHPGARLANDTWRRGQGFWARKRATASGRSAWP